MSSRQLVAIVVALIVPLAAIAQDIDYLGGNWNWVSTTYTAGGVDTPETVGYTVQLHFGTDHSFVRYRDGVPQVTSTWHLTDIYAPPYMIEELSTGAGDLWYTHSVSWGEQTLLTLADSVALPTGVVGPHTRTEMYMWISIVPNEGLTWGQVKALFR
jgi:hypothetical protein